MHLHTRASFDSLNDPDGVIRAASRRGIARVCVTDHNEIDRALEMKARHPDRVIVGEEVKTAERVDVIGLYLHEKIPAGTPALETCRRIKEQGGIVYVPHPFAGGKGGGGALLPRIEPWIDVLEGFNARLHDAALNRRAVEWAAERGLPMGGGSDAHTLSEIGRGWAEVPVFEDDPASFLAALKAGAIGGEMSSRWVHAGSLYARVHKRFSA